MEDLAGENCLGAGTTTSDAENECVKANLLSGQAKSSVPVSMSSTYDANTPVLTLLNAWVSETNANNGDNSYTEWKNGTDNWPRLKTE